MNKVTELFGYSTKAKGTKWASIINGQQCPYAGKRCYKTRKSDPSIAIGTCSVLYSGSDEPIVICPTRLTENRQIFTDCLHLLTTHEPGNQLHIVSEVSVPGGSVDFFLVSARDNKVKDFVGIELQTLDTTGTVWPERQRLLKELGVPRADAAEDSEKPFGMNWKMTAKTILVQMHHKVQTFEHVNKKLVLVVQDKLLDYMKREFRFNHIHTPAMLGDSLHLHCYTLKSDAAKQYQLALLTRGSTDSAGVAECLGLQTEAKVELEDIIRALERKISATTLFKIV